MKASDNKLKKLKSAVISKDDYWYITKQELDFSKLCYIADILSKWDENGELNYEDFFNSIKITEPYNSFISQTAHRATVNLAPYGLAVEGKNYNSSNLTPVFYKIKSITGGDFNNTTLYQKIIDNQIEKIIIKTQNICIFPMMFTFKVLLTLGDVTGSYSVSKDEFKTFIATASEWKEFFEVVDSILRYRSDENYKKQIAQTVGKKTASDSRLNLVLSNHSMIDVSDNIISIVSEKIGEVRIKVAQYELTNPTVIDIDKANNRLVSITTFDTIQQVLFGAPGVGKSHHLKSIYEDENDVIRITFHPETDYASFVGCYKPLSDGDEIVYKFQGQAFTEAYIKAWERFVGDAERKDTYLVIEEVNRGNCAQIFGDIFQLLDRNEQGFSEYTVRPDKDLATYLKDEFNNIASNLNKIKPGLDTGEILMLPPNLHILATMNTSDQSLFPIDSAFKRRWDWVYMPIETKPKDDEGETITRRIVTKENIYDWGEFLDNVNQRIFATTESEDKQLGFWFVKPKSDDTTISAEDFVSKVIFFLWNDIYKDFGDDATSIFYFALDGNPDSKEKVRHSFKDFTPAFKKINVSLVDAFIKNLRVKPIPETSADNSSENSTD
ncbi:MAG: AlwI family type II restriction endonuclease [Muribaculaceae bacterium]|nr:AlwI family type II restriction endonuclease [Muribaculaceae bacterium]